ncbi:hypothetical protein ANANG_G00223970 [Anguilla anguilla]|uniref:Uncharacterized protein n=1 Tax=Anguilla anguilla TaxID=7936 RepID=A0A9D3LZ01_ANGAN|nr:hypothetical protein ANANG_G00223970 [Anguilla anguilla]
MNSSTGINEDIAKSTSPIRQQSLRLTPLLLQGALQIPEVLREQLDLVCAPIQLGIKDIRPNVINLLKQKLLFYDVWFIVLLKGVGRDPWFDGLHLGIRGLAERVPFILLILKGVCRPCDSSLPCGALFLFVIFKGVIFLAIGDLFLRVFFQDLFCKWIKWIFLNWGRVLFFKWI